jgi:3-deoxy-D-manno-octulosonate 8-phosphate phosphatase (KDO 8-P phosphatase)
MKFDHSKFKLIKAFAFDVDGVLTDGKVLVTDQGEFLRIMSVRDGQAMKIALLSGYLIFIITKGASLGVRNRLELLKVTEVYDKVTNKLDIIKEIILKYGLIPEEILYMGDDLPDLDVFGEVGIAACPYDAVEEVIEQANFISDKKGGEGCVRDVVQRVLKSQGNWYNKANL